MDYKYFADLIKESVSMHGLLDRYGFKLDHANFMCCPFHNEKTASFKAFPGDGGFHCFGCGEHGDIITFVMKFFNLSFIDALKKINDDFHLGFPIGEKLSRAKQQQIDKSIYFKRKAQEAEEKQREALQDRYYSFIDTLNRLDAQKRKFAPKPGDPELHPKFIEAVQNIDRIDFELGQIETEVWKHEHRS